MSVNNNIILSIIQLFLVEKNARFKVLKLQLYFLEYKDLISNIFAKDIKLLV